MEPNGDVPQSVYHDEIATLQEMLDRERETLPLLEEYLKEPGKNSAGIVWRIAQAQKKIEALKTAIEVMGGAL